MLSRIVLFNELFRLPTGLSPYVLAFSTALLRKILMRRKHLNAMQSALNAGQPDRSWRRMLRCLQHRWSPISN